MIFLCFLANVINFIDRANLAIAAPYITTELGLDAAQTNEAGDVERTAPANHRNQPGDQRQRQG